MAHARHIEQYEIGISDDIRRKAHVVHVVHFDGWVHQTELALPVRMAAKLAQGSNLRIEHPPVRFFRKAAIQASPS